LNARLTSLGTHLLLDLKSCNPEVLDDLHFIKQAIMGAADEAGATVVGEKFHKFSPVGVTGIVAIAESHLSIHTWPEYSYAAVDIFTCGENFKAYKAADLIIELLQCKEPSIQEVRRGTMSELVASPV
jgi:S-adenosylmethionine decarboxylase